MPLLQVQRVQGIWGFKIFKGINPDIPIWYIRVPFLPKYGLDLVIGELCWLGVQSLEFGFFYDKVLVLILSFLHLPAAGEWASEYATKEALWLSFLAFYSWLTLSTLCYAFPECQLSLAIATQALELLFPPYISTTWHIAPTNRSLPFIYQPSSPLVTLFTTALCQGPSVLHSWPVMGTSLLARSWMIEPQIPSWHLLSWTTPGSNCGKLCSPGKNPEMGVRCEG